MLFYLFIYIYDILIITNNDAACVEVFPVEPDVSKWLSPVTLVSICFLWDYIVN